MNLSIKTRSSVARTAVGSTIKATPRLPADQSWNTGSATVTRKQVLAAAGSKDIFEASKRLDNKFISDARVAMSDGVISSAEKATLNSAAAYAAAAKGLQNGNGSVTFNTTVTVKTDGSAWYSSSIAKLKTLNGMMAGKTPAEQIAIQTAFAPFRKVGLGNPYYVVKNGDNLSTIAESLLQQGYARSITSKSDCPWFVNGKLTPNGARLNVKDEEKYIQDIGGWDKYAASDRFKVRTSMWFADKVKADNAIVVSVLGTRNELPSNDYINTDGVLSLPSLQDMKDAGALK
jgi:hypothetical protein